MDGLVQIVPCSFLDEGVDRVVQMTRDYARLSGLCLFTYTWSKSCAYRSFRPVEGHPRGPEYEFHGGLYVTPHAEYYKDTPIKPARLRTQDPPFKDVDILEQVLRPCQAAGLKVYAALWLGFEPEHVHKLEPALEACTEVEAEGRALGLGLGHGWMKTGSFQHCFNNPEYRAFHRGLVEDQLRSYPIDGLLFLTHERYGPVEKVLISGTPPTCFCPHCIAKGKARGIDVEAARAGLQALYDFATQARNEGYRLPPDGHFTSLIRLLLRYPEILAWERLWAESVDDYSQELYLTAKKVRPEAKVGLHVWQASSWGLFNRGETYYSERAKASDWIKPVLYDKPAGVRLIETYAKPCHQTILRDLDFEDVVRFLLQVMGQEPPASSAVLAQEGLGASYVEQETARAAKAAQGKALIYPGLGIDVEPPPAGSLEYPNQSPEEIEAAVMAAKRGGATGFVLSVNYSQMREQSLRAVGHALSATESV